MLGYPVGDTQWELNQAMMPAIDTQSKQPEVSDGKKELIGAVEDKVRCGHRKLEQMSQVHRDERLRCVVWLGGIWPNGFFD